VIILAFTIPVVFARGKATFQDVNENFAYGVTALNEIYDNVTGKLKKDTTGNADTATNVTTQINGQAISSIFESDGVTAKSAASATTATTAESCSGNSATATTSETAVTGPEDSLGFFYSLNTPFYNASVDNILTCTESGGPVSRGSWYTVGPTGSGASVIWSALDSLPDGTKAIKINLYARSSYSDRVISMSFTEASASTGGICIAAQNQTNEFNVIDLKINVNKRFKFRWDLTTGTYSANTMLANAYLQGYWK
jgi:hypothetical protein